MVDVLLGVEPAYNATEVCDIFDRKDKSHDIIEQRDIDNLHELFSHEEIDMLTDLNLISYIANLINDPNSMFTISKSNAIAIQKAKKELMHNEASRGIQNYEGTYGNFLFENVTITNPESCESCLHLQYGRLGNWILEPTNVTDVFLGFGDVGYLSVITCEFLGEDEIGNAMYLGIPLFEPSNPPIFKRDLLMSEAPLPRNDLCVPAY